MATLFRKIVILVSCNLLLQIDVGIAFECIHTAFGDNVGWQYYPKVGLSYAPPRTFYAETERE